MAIYLWLCKPKIKFMKKSFILFSYIILVFLIFFSQIILSQVKSIFNRSVDTSLNGFTASISKPEYLTFNSFKNGKFQKDFTSWYESNLTTRGYFVKIYNTLRFKIFHLANRIVGNNNFIYESSYVNASLSLNKMYDYSIKENKNAMREFVNDLVKLQRRLKKLGKYLYIFISPSKVHLYPESIPSKYYAIQKRNAISPMVSFKKFVDKTNLNVRFASYDMKGEIKYPAFYSTGIHWSRTFETLASKKIIEDLNKITGKKYRNIKLSKVKKRKKCFWRDCDVYSLLNVFGPTSKENYYEYRIKRDIPDKYDKMRFLLYGDSFSMGLINDVTKLYPDEKFIIRLDRDNQIQFIDKPSILLNQNYNNADIASYLHSSDVVIIEMIEPEIIKYSNGFVKHLLKILSQENVTELKRDDKKYENLLSGSGINFDASVGLYNQYRRGVWTSKYAVINLKNKRIGKNGFMINFKVPKQIIKKFKSQKVAIYINQKKVYEENLKNPGFYNFKISSNDVNIPKDDIYEITLNLEHVFIPNNHNAKSNDNRKLGVLIKYIGDIK